MRDESKSRSFLALGKIGYDALVDEIAWRTSESDPSYCVVLADEANFKDFHYAIAKAGGNHERLLHYHDHQRRGRAYTEEEIEKLNSRLTIRMTNGKGDVDEIAIPPHKLGDRRIDYTEPFSLGNQADAEVLIRDVNINHRSLSSIAEIKNKDGQELENLPIRTVVQLWPGEDDEKYLDQLLARTKVEYYTTQLNFPDPETGKYEPEGIIPHGGTAADSWPEHFGPLSEWKVEPPKEIVRQLIVEGCLHVFTGLFGTAKTMFAYEMASAILNRRPVGGCFEVEQSYPILNLCLDMSSGLQLKYARYFGLDKQPQFMGIRPEVSEQLGLDDPRVQAAVKAKIVLIDTMLDYAGIQEAAQSHEWILFMNKLRDLMKIYGCVAIVLLVHPTKSVEHDSTVAATKFLKDSVTFGGKVDVAFAFVRIQKSSKIFVERIKGRPWDRPITFTIATHDEQGNSYIDRGEFPVIEAPGEAGTLADHLSVKPGRKAAPDKEEKVRFLRTLKDMSFEKMAGELNKKFGGKHVRSTVKKWLEEDSQLSLGDETNDPTPF